MARDEGDWAYSVVSGATIWGVAGAKIYRLGGQLPSFDMNHLGRMSFSWYVRLPGGALAACPPTPLYEALAAVLIAGALWAIGKRWNPPAVFGAYLVFSGISRFFVEILRINEPAVLGLTQPQLWALAGLAVGVVLILHTRPLNRRRAEETEASASGELLTAGSVARPR